MNITGIWIILLIFLVGLLITIYAHNQMINRNESEYMDIIEYQTMSMSALLSQSDPTLNSSTKSLLNSISNIRFFPDLSGKFYIFDMNGKIWDIKSQNFISDPSLPTSSIVKIITDGNTGGYIRFIKDGLAFRMFVYGVKINDKNTFIVGSGLYIDQQHIDERNNWSRKQKTIYKPSPSAQPSSSSLSI